MCKSVASMLIWREDKFWQSFATQKKLNFLLFSYPWAITSWSKASAKLAQRNRLIISNFVIPVACVKLQPESKIIKTWFQTGPLL